VYIVSAVVHASLYLALLVVVVVATSFLRHLPPFGTKAEVKVSDRCKVPGEQTSRSRSTTVP
jgi:hypothetical protein